MSYGYHFTLTHKSSEYILANGELKPGPDLPLEIVLHKMVNINSTHTMIIGGKTSKNEVIVRYLDLQISNLNLLYLPTQID